MDGTPRPTAGCSGARALGLEFANAYSGPAVIYLDDFRRGAAKALQRRWRRRWPWTTPFPSPPHPRSRLSLSPGRSERQGRSGAGRRRGSHEPINCIWRLPDGHRVAAVVRRSCEPRLPRQEPLRRPVMRRAWRGLLDGRCASHGGRGQRRARAARAHRLARRIPGSPSSSGWRPVPKRRRATGASYPRAARDEAVGVSAH
jgi:hypothetical protein